VASDRQRRGHAGRRADRIGQTLAAFLWAIDKLAALPPPGDPKRRTRVLYVSPLKALAVDIERNLRAPLTGIRQAAHRLGLEEPDIKVAVRTGDTAAEERRKLASKPPDISSPRRSVVLAAHLAGEGNPARVETVILDEVHAVAATSAAHTWPCPLSALTPCARTRGRDPRGAAGRPVRHRAAGPGGRHLPGRQPPGHHRAAAQPKRIELQVVVPVEDMTELDTVPGRGTGQDGDGLSDPAPRRSIWPHVEERVLDLIEQHKSTIVFANSRRLAERLCGRLNELAAERAEAGVAAGAPAEVARATTARSHGWNVPRSKKRSRRPAAGRGRDVQPELGIDMGAVDLVIQVEAPPSVASGLQRVAEPGTTSATSHAASSSPSTKATWSSPPSWPNACGPARSKS